MRMLIVFALTVSFFACKAKPEPQTVDIDPAVRLEVGDVVFTRIDNPLYRQVAEATGGWTSHVGVIVDATPGAEVVAESSVPLSKLTPLTKFISRSYKGIYAVKRLKDPLAESEKTRVVFEAAKRLGILYHTGFKYESQRQYCSKFVYDVLMAAAGEEVGQLQTVREIRAANPKAGETFWRVWYLGKIPWERRMVTPVSQWESDKLVTVTEHGLDLMNDDSAAVTLD